MHPNQLTEILNRPISRELLARDLTRLAYVAMDGTPRCLSERFRTAGDKTGDVMPRRVQRSLHGVNVGACRRPPASPVASS